VAKVSVNKVLAPTRRACLGCDAIGEPVAYGAPVCKFCAEAGAQAVIERIWVRHETHGNLVAALSAALGERLAELDDDERRRWRQFDRARVAVSEGKADDATIRKVNRTIASLKKEDSGVTPRMCVAWRAEEEWYWQSVSHHDLRERYQAQTKILTEWFNRQKEEESV
jgi:hypothetical protein